MDRTTLAFSSDETVRSILTLDQTAELLQVHRKTILKWIKEGRLPAIQLGPRSYRVRFCDVMDLWSGVTMNTANPRVM